MNNPIDRNSDLESRIDKLERGMKQVKSTLEHIRLDTGDARESLDAIERRQVGMNKQLCEMTQTQTDHNEKFDTLERGLQLIKQDIAAIHDVFVGDFDRIETTMATKEDLAVLRAEHGDLLREILRRLPEKGE